MRPDKKDQQLLDLLNKHVKESVIREYVRSLLTEAALDVRNLGEKVIVLHDRGDTFSVTLHAKKLEGEKPFYYNEDMLGTFEARKFGRCSGAYEVRWAEAPKGWGPLLYDVGMEYATMKGGGLVSDRNSVTPAAAHVWDYYYNNRDDVDYEQLDDYEGRLTPNDESDDCNQEIVYTGVHDTMRKSWDFEEGNDESWEKTGKAILLRSPLSKVYRWGGYSVIDDLRNAGKLVML
jgi:hypothetical protein